MPIPAFRRWLLGPERERARSFVTFLWQRFLADRCFETAGALSYSTVFALVPLATVAFGVLAAFPVFEAWSGALSDFIFQHFVPGAARAVQDYVGDFAGTASRLTLAGVAGVVVVALVTMAGIEQTFNRIWRVTSPRPRLTRFLVFWTVLTLGGFVAVASLAVSTTLLSLPAFGGEEARTLGGHLLRWVPTLLLLAGFTAAYMVVPNRTVAWRHAAAGAVLATLVFEGAKWGLTAYLRTVPAYQQLYGALAVLPIFLLWVYLSWVAVLLGASLAASLSSFRYQPSSRRLPAGHELYALLRLLGRLQARRAQGGALHVAELHALEPMLTDDLMQRMLGDLHRIGALARDEGGGWLLARDLDALPLGELYEAGALRIPLDAAALPDREDAVGGPAAAALDALRDPLRVLLSRSVASLLAPAPPAAPPTGSETP
jgi:membrane protein